MPTLAPAPFIESISAPDLAEKNWRRNIASLAITQPTTVETLGRFYVDRHWIFARDGSLTALEPTGRWWADCSVPLLASRALLKTLTAGHAGSCLLSPPNAAMVVAAQERIGFSVPLFVIQPDLDIARMILSCHDFSDQIARKRLWLGAGSSWPEELLNVFDRYPGLATPGQFIRTKLTPDSIAVPLVAEAQNVFSTVASQRAERITELQSSAVPNDSSADLTNRKQALLIGPAEFRLWEDGAHVLHQQISDEFNVNWFDTTDPLNSSPIALLQAAQHSGCIMSANLCRADCNHLLSKDTPWITWMTQPGAPQFQAAGPHDALILADAAWRKYATIAGWPEDRVKIHGWPESSPALSLNPRIHATDLAMIVDTHRLEIPASVKQFSSHRLLWELIEEELAVNPFAIDTVDDYLTDRSGQLNIAADALDRRTFIDRLILPAYQQSVARVLITSRVPLALWGQGWSELEEFTAAARGELTDRQTFHSAVSSAKAILHCWPDRSAHPITALGKPLVYPGNDAATLIRNALRASSTAARRPAIAPGEDRPLARLIQTLLTT